MSRFFQFIICFIEYLKKKDVYHVTLLRVKMVRRSKEIKVGVFFGLMKLFNTKLNINQKDNKRKNNLSIYPTKKYHPIKLL